MKMKVIIIQKLNLRVFLSWLIWGLERRLYIHMILHWLASIFFCADNSYTPQFFDLDWLDQDSWLYDRSQKDKACIARLLGWMHGSSPESSKSKCSPGPDLWVPRCAHWVLSLSSCPHFWRSCCEHTFSSWTGKSPQYMWPWCLVREGSPGPEWWRQPHRQHLHGYNLPPGGSFLVHLDSCTFGVPL